VPVLREAGHELTGFFYNPNIQPYSEYIRREETLKKCAQQVELPLLESGPYDFANHLRGAAFHEDNRCAHCFYMRLRLAAETAKKIGADAFSTTLLLSPYQDHEVLRTAGEKVAEVVGVRFAYVDLRPHYKESFAASRRYGLYRQPYCGCVYSEYERYQDDSAKLRKKIAAEIAAIPSQPESK
jgi:predicted adenine nucleotide alpha hydrolase (AANH) superfamily ATPase